LSRDGKLLKVGDVLDALTLSGLIQERCFGVDSELDPAMRRFGFQYEITDGMFSAADFSFPDWSEGQSVELVFALNREMNLGDRSVFPGGQPIG
jgi:hypothetical protein